MLGLEDLEIGLIFWAEEDALKTLRKAKAFGVRTGQIGFPGDLPLEGAAEKCDDALNVAAMPASNCRSNAHVDLAMICSPTLLLSGQITELAGYNGESMTQPAEPMRQLVVSGSSRILWSAECLMD